MHHPSQLDRFTARSVLSECELTLPTLLAENNSGFDQGSLFPLGLATQMYTCTVSPHASSSLREQGSPDVNP